MAVLFLTVKINIKCRWPGGTGGGYLRMVVEVFEETPNDDTEEWLGIFTKSEKQGLKYYKDHKI